MPNVWRSWSLRLLDPSRPVQGSFAFYCNTDPFWKCTLLLLLLLLLLGTDVAQSDNRRIVVRVLARARHFPLLHISKTSFVFQPTSYWKSTSGSSCRGKEAGTWIQPLTFICSGFTLPSPVLPAVKWVSLFDYCVWRPSKTCLFFPFKQQNPHGMWQTVVYVLHRSQKLGWLSEGAFTSRIYCYSPPHPPPVYCLLLLWHKLWRKWYFSTPQFPSGHFSRKLWRST